MKFLFVDFFCSCRMCWSFKKKLKGNTKIYAPSYQFVVSVWPYVAGCLSPWKHFALYTVFIVVYCLSRAKPCDSQGQWTVNATYHNIWRGSETINTCHQVYQKYSSVHLCIEIPAFWFDFSHMATDMLKRHKVVFLCAICVHLRDMFKRHKTTWGRKKTISCDWCILLEDNWLPVIFTASTGVIGDYTPSL